jgi:hypothetical protein
VAEAVDQVEDREAAVAVQEVVVDTRKTNQPD